MLRLMTTMIAMSLVGVASVAYNAKDETRALQAQARQAEALILQRRAEIAVLRAEWAYLNGPIYLGALARRFKGEIGYVPAQPEQMGSLQEVPTRGPAAPEPAGERLAARSDAS